MLNKYNQDGELDLNERLSYMPIPVAHVLRDGKKYLIEAKEMIVSDIVYLDAKVSGIIPADIVLFETSDDFEICPYIDCLDTKTQKNLKLMREYKYKMP